MPDVRSSTGLASQRPLQSAASLNASQRQWQSDLAALRQNAQSRFADVEWGPGTARVAVHAHKCILYARAPGAFLQQYIEEGTEYAGDIALLETALDYFYTAEREAEAVTILLDGFGEAQARNDDSASEVQDAVQKLRRDLMYCWRSKLFSDATLVLECAPEVAIAVHRAVLASRSPYFRALLLGEYSDAGRSSFALPSPPFTPASTTFVLGWMYGGTLDSIARRFDLATAFEIWRCAEFLGAASLRDEVESGLKDMLSDTRAPRVYAFAHAPDVNCERLARLAENFIVQHFETAWTASPAIGELSYTEQLGLVSKVAEQVTVANVVAMAVRVASGRRRLANSVGASSDHTLAMFDGVEDRLAKILANDLAGVVTTRAFVDLVEGFGFHGDVLERLLALVVQGLNERNAPATYALLYGDVLLRENGLMADARRLVVDALEGVASYVRRRLPSVQAAGGFRQIPAAALQELASVLVTPAHELLGGSLLQRPPAAPSRPAPSHLLQGLPSRRPQPVPKHLATQEVPRCQSRQKALAATTRAAGSAVRSGSNAVRAPQDSLVGRRSVLRPSSSVGRGLSASHQGDERSLSEMRHPERTGATPTPASAEPRASRYGASPAVASTGTRIRPPFASSRRVRPAMDSMRLPALTRPSTADPALSETPRAGNSATSSSRETATSGFAAKSKSHRSGAARPSQGVRARRPVSISPSSSRLSADGTFPSKNVGVSNGNELLLGIPCVVRIPGVGPSGLRAQARYIGELAGTSGSWVGIEAEEASIPAEASALEWNDGSRDGTCYFRLMSADGLKKTFERSEARQCRTAQPEDDLPVSSTSNSEAPCACTRGLFVRPDTVAFIVR